MLNLKRGAKRRNDHNILFGDLLPGNELCTIGIHDELDSAILEVVVHFLVVDHLAKEVNIFPNTLFQRFVTDLDGIFHTITKTEMPGQNKLDGAKVEHRRGKILFAQVLSPARLFDLACDRRTVIDWYIELFDGSVFIIVAKVQLSSCS